MPLLVAGGDGCGSETAVLPSDAERAARGALLELSMAAVTAEVGWKPEPAAEGIATGGERRTNGGVASAVGPLSLLMPPILLRGGKLERRCSLSCCSRARTVRGWGGDGNTPVPRAEGDKACL